MIKLPSDFRKNIAPYRVFLNWEITHECNYKCSYCPLSGIWGTKTPTPSIYPGINKLIEVWYNIYERYGSCVIVFTGGEPFVYPEFIDIISVLSDIHAMEFSTNFFWDVDDFIKRIKPGRARIGVSFHPEFVNFDTFFLKALRIKEAGFELWVNYVAYPSLMEGIDKYKDKFEQFGISMSILPFKGEYDGKAYPESYTQQERECLKRLGTSIRTQKTLDFAFAKDKRENKDKFCRMGQMYAKIRPNGEVYNCCAESALKLGNIFNGTFFLLEEPYLCKDTNCPCWRCMLVENEGYWLEHWPAPALPMKDTSGTIY